MELPQIAEVEAAIDRLSAELTVVGIEPMDNAASTGRILAHDLLADRDSPALDVSAMDGFAVRLESIGHASIPVAATSVAGGPPTELGHGQAVKIFTGAPVPASAECVIRREDTLESDGAVRINLSRDAVVEGQNIRRQGENVTRGQTVLPAGTELNAAAIAAMASFGPSKVDVRRKVRVAILNTGDELAAAGEPVEAWMIRDSNGPTLEAWLRSLPWVEVVSRVRVADRFDDVCDAIKQNADESDAVILTGGVSMGDTDYVPGAIESLGGEIVFHRLPIRPGKPILGASLQGKLLLGLPGNPVSVAVTARVFGSPLLSRLAGRTRITAQPLVELDQPDDKKLALTWFRLVSISPDGRVRLAASKGSGDLVSLSVSSGFVTIPPEQSGPGPWQLTCW